MTRKANAPEATEALTRALGVFGSLDLHVDEVVVPVYSLGERSSGEYRAIGQFYAGLPGAGNWNVVHLATRGRVEPGTVVKVHRIGLSNDTGRPHMFYQVSYQGGNPAFSTTRVPIWTDQRIHYRPSCRVGQYVTAIDPGTGIDEHYALACETGLTRVYELEGVYLDPEGVSGSSLALWASTNEIIQGWFEWSEIPLSDAL